MVVNLTVCIVNKLLVSVIVLERVSG